MKTLLSFIGVGVNKKTARYYKQIAKELTENEDWLVENCKIYPLMVKCEPLELYTCFDTREDVVKLREAIVAEIYRAENTSWLHRMFCFAFGHTTEVGLCARCLRKITHGKWERA
jgi:hypothetical protein